MKSDIEKRLQTLLNNGSMAFSSCSAELLDFVAPLIAGGVLCRKRSGGGQRLIIENAEALSHFIAQQFPHAAGEFGETWSRIESLARFRDTKTLPNNVPEIVCARGWNCDVLKRDGKILPVANATQEFGVFAFLLNEPQRYEIHGRCALIENPAVFAAFERLGLNAEIALFARGRCSNRFLDWIVSQAAVQILHLPDYDPVGLSEHERLRKRLGEKVKLYLPPNIAELFERYANKKLLRNPVAQSALLSLRNNCGNQVAEALALIDRHNGGLEQEALLIQKKTKFG
ncbi:MAG: hypothetical protein ABIP71_15735 [Verrucomicrobiota bacterium]